MSQFTRLRLVCFPAECSTGRSTAAPFHCHSTMCQCRKALFRIIRSTVQLKCDGTRAETRFRLSAKRTSQFKSAGASVQSTTGSRGVRISGSNAGYIMFRGSVKGTGYPLHSPVFPSIPLPCVTVCHHISTGLYMSSLKPLTVKWMPPMNCTAVSTYCCQNHLVYT